MGTKNSHRNDVAPTKSSLARRDVENRVQRQSSLMSGAVLPKLRSKLLLDAVLGRITINLINKKTTQG